MRSLAPARHVLVLCATLLVLACEAGGPASIILNGTADEDADGWMASRDCDDLEPKANPGRHEVCMDGIDNDCDQTHNGCGLDPVIDLSGAHARLVGEGPGDHAGWSVASGGDIDGDGFDDVLVGAYEDAEGGDFAGAVFVFYGPLLGSINLNLADAKLVGEEPYDHAGWSMASAGDLNRDGFDDILVGAYGADTAGVSAGAVYVVLGPVEGTIDLSEADGRLDGANPYDYLGISVAGVGDVNGDGYADVALGAYGFDTENDDAGAVFVFRGPLLGIRSVTTADATLLGGGYGDWFGWSVAAAGDVNGDGLADVVVGAPGVPSADGPDSGAAYLYLGPLTGIRTAAGATATFRATRGNDRAGGSVSAGDLDGDGHSDLVIGGWGADEDFQDAGAVWVFYGPVDGNHPLDSADAIISGEKDGDNAGIAVAVVGDVNSDDRADLLVGAVNDDSGGPASGAAWLLYGPLEGEVSLAQADVKLIGEVWDDRAGGSVAGAGDTDGDGFDDILVGAHGNDSGGANAGAAYLVCGRGW